jgi:hypothetical protein
MKGEGGKRIGLAHDDEWCEAKARELKKAAIALDAVSSENRR